MRYYGEYQGGIGERKESHEAVFPSVKAAVEVIEFWAQGHTFGEAWINDKPFKIRKGKVVDEHGQELTENSVAPLPQSEAMRRAHENYKNFFARSKSYAALKGMGL